MHNLFNFTTAETSFFFSGDLKMEIFGGDYLFWEVLKFKS